MVDLPEQSVLYDTDCYVRQPGSDEQKCAAIKADSVMVKFVQSKDEKSVYIVTA